MCTGRGPQPEVDMREPVKGQVHGTGGNGYVCTVCIAEEVDIHKEPQERHPCRGALLCRQPRVQIHNLGKVSSRAFSGVGLRRYRRAMSLQCDGNVPGL